MYGSIGSVHGFRPSGWRIPNRAAKTPERTRVGHSGCNSRPRILVAHSVLVHSGTEHTAALDRSTCVATFGSRPARTVIDRQTSGVSIRPIAGARRDRPAPTAPC